ncbi:hypothetical protein Tco_0487333 [Tanacetum coccineum]
MPLMEDTQFRQSLLEPLVILHLTSQTRSAIVISLSVVGQGHKNSRYYLNYQQKGSLVTTYCCSKKRLVAAAGAFGTVMEDAAAKRELKTCCYN